MDAIQSRLLSICYPLPDVRCGNSIFIPLGCSGTRTLKSAGYEEKANEMFERITFNAKSYDEALNIISEYVEPVENYEESFQMKGFE